MHNVSALSLETGADATCDEAAAVRAAQRDIAAVAPLYYRYRDRVYAYLRARTGNPEDAADLTQQVFVQAIDALPRYRIGKTPFAAWLFRIARNAVTDFHRRQRTTVVWDLLPETLQPRSAHDLEAGVLRREAVTDLHAIVGALDAETREMLALRFAGGLSIAEIAAVVGKSEAATQKKLHRTIQSLQEQYHDHTR